MQHDKRQSAIQRAWHAAAQRLPLAWLRAVKRPELPVLVALFVLAGSTWLFITLVDEVREGDTQRFDQWVVDSLRAPGSAHRPRGPRWLVQAGHDITALGSSAVLTVVTIAAAGYLLLRRKQHAMVLMLLVVITGVVLSNGLKFYFARERPPGASDVIDVLTYSFPSGHSMLSAIVYLALGMMLARMEERRVIRYYFIGLAVLLTLLVGASRVYLGVHYPTDVLGGWTAGLAWAIVWWLIARRLQNRGVVEQTGDSALRTSPQQ